MYLSVSLFLSTLLSLAFSLSLSLSVLFTSYPFPIIHLNFAYSFVLKNGPTPASFSFIFGLFKQTLQFLQYVKNVHPVYGDGIRTHDLRNVSLSP